MTKELNMRNILTIYSVLLILSACSPLEPEYQSLDELSQANGAVTSTGVASTSGFNFYPNQTIEKSLAFQGKLISRDNANEVRISNLAMTIKYTSTKDSRTFSWGDSWTLSATNQKLGDRYDYSDSQYTYQSTLVGELQYNMLFIQNKKSIAGDVVADGVMVLGNPIQNNTPPSSGTVRYASLGGAAVVGKNQDSGDNFRLKGNVNVDVDFSDNTFSAVLDQLDGEVSASNATNFVPDRIDIKNADISPGASFNSTSITATRKGTKISAFDGSSPQGQQYATGLSFYGTKTDGAAEEVAGFFEFTDPTRKNRLVGGFIAAVKK